MRVGSEGHLTYCMNVHPGETWEEVLQAIRIHLPRVKAEVSPRTPFGVGLRLSGRACETGRGREQELQNALDEVGAYAFTVNAFPHGAFHDTRVKETVYLPDWSEKDRIRYTLSAAEILAGVLPPGISGSVSTVPLGYKYRTGKESDQTPAWISTLTETVKGLRELEDRTGKYIHLGLEPEPDCILETTEETVSFFHQLFDLPEAPLFRKYLGVCLDTCHVALQFEDPAESLRTYRKEGIRVSKIQLSAALEVEASDARPEILHPFDDGVYFHQTTSSSGNRWRDLPDWMKTPDPTAGTLRVHCHVPLDWAGGSPLRSTRHTLHSTFWQEIAQIEAPHVEVETYTFGVLPPEVQRYKSVEKSISDECQWVLSHISNLNELER